MGQPSTRFPDTMLLTVALQLLLAADAGGTRGPASRAECYAKRYPDLARTLCAADGACDLRRAKAHYRAHGRREGRRFGCDATAGATPTHKTKSIRHWAHKLGTEPEQAFVKVENRDGAVTGVTGYRSAASELVWLNGTRKGKICATAESPEVEASARKWTSYARRAWRPGGGPAPKPTPEEWRALSHFHVGQRHDRSVTAFVEPIEPLHGIARHPFARVCNHSLAHKHDIAIYDITYLVIHNQCGRPGPKPRTLLFDMGASVGFKGVPGGVYATMPPGGGGLAPSLPLFYRMYADRCLEPDEIYAWEPRPLVRGADWWGQLPARIRAKVHFYEDFVNEGELSVAEGSHPVQSFMEILEATAKPGDFVADCVEINYSNDWERRRDHSRAP